MMLSRRDLRRPYRPGHRTLVLLERSAGEELINKSQRHAYRVGRSVSGMERDSKQPLRPAHREDP